ncbi:copper amine oxidase N-terminal domain-containing protein [Paenibacillus sp. WLX2291]|uniref:copper amine oxidase N-terminal domain-containing protein n=1 Tax=Paenibacillus sp. WLX2291 TaxID=3296934 RepID=UPI0039843184
MLTKKLSIVAVTTLFSTVVGLQTTSYAASEANIKVTVNQSTVQFPDQKPLMDANRVLIPTRFVAQSLGGKVGYNSATKTVIIQQDSKTITLKINSSKVTAGGKVVTLDVPAKVVKGRTMVPLRFVSEAMGATVDWQQARNLVAITTGSTTTPVPETPTTTEGNFKFDQNFTTMGKKLFVNNLVEANGKVTFTVPEGATAYYRAANFAKTDLVTGKQYSYNVGKGEGLLYFTYIDSSKIVPGAPKQAEYYTISLDGTRWGFTNANKAIVSVEDSKLKESYGTVEEVTKLAKSL